MKNWTDTARPMRAAWGGTTRRQGHAGSYPSLLERSTQVQCSAYYRMGREQEFADAIELFNQVIEIDPAVADAYAFRGLSFLGLSQREEGVEDLVMAFALEPALGVEYLTVFDRAVATDFDHAIAVDAELYDAYLSRGLTHYLLENYVAAATGLEHYLTWTPDAENRERLNERLFDAINQTESGELASPASAPGQSADNTTEQRGDESMMALWPQIIYAGGGKIAEISADGDVWIYSNYVGNVVAGDIWVEGNDEGDLTDDGEVWMAGDKIGDITVDREIWYEGEKIGEVEADGTIWYEENVIGSTEGGKWEYAAVLLFYGFYDEFLQ